MRLRKKPVEIEGVQFTGNNFDEIKSFCPVAEKFHTNESDRYGTGYNLGIKTLEGIMEAMPNDWILKGVKGEFYPCKPDILALTYDIVE